MPPYETRINDYVLIITAANIYSAIQNIEPRDPFCRRLERCLRGHSSQWPHSWQWGLSRIIPDKPLNGREALGFVNNAVINSTQILSMSNNGLQELVTDPERRHLPKSINTNPKRFFIIQAHMP